MKPLQFEGVHGASFMRPSEVDLLVRNVDRYRFLFEIGTANGATTAAALLAVPDASALCVDLFHDFTESLEFDSGERHMLAWLRNRALVNNRMSLWVGDYMSLLVPGALLQKIYLIFLDADHSYEATRRELLRLSAAFLNHDEAGDVMLLVHDYEVSEWPGVTQAVNELLVPTQHGDALFVVEGRAESLLELRFKRSRVRTVHELLEDSLKLQIARQEPVEEQTESSAACGQLTKDAAETVIRSGPVFACDRATVDGHSKLNIQWPLGRRMQDRDPD